MSPNVYAVILNWNRPNDTLDCLGSLDKLEYDNFHLVVVDNCSTTESVATLNAGNTTAHLIVNERNLGYAAGNNVGIRYAIGEGADYILVLNDDTIVVPNALIELVRVGETDTRIGIMCPKLVSYYDHSKEYAGGRINWERFTVEEVLSKSSPQESVRDVDYAPGSALLIKRCVIQEIGLLDEAFFAYLEDVDWSVRCQRAGYRVVVVPHAVVYHKGTPDQIELKSPGVRFYWQRNQWMFMRKLAQPSHWLTWSAHFMRQGLMDELDAEAHKDYERADAILDGWWGGVVSRSKGERRPAPGWFKLLVKPWLGLLHGLLTLPERLRMRFPVRTTVRRLWHAVRH